MPGKAAPAVEEELEAEERGCFEYYAEQSVLSPSAEDTLHAQNIVERGKRRAEEQESITLELFSLLTEMREEMKRRGERFRGKLRWRDENMAAENRTREENLATVLQ